MFIDTSVIIPILAAEPDATEWASRIEAGSTRITSPLVVLEAVMRLSSLLAVDPVIVHTTITSLLMEAEINVFPIEAADGDVAIQAFAKYGKGRGHPAQLNLADCLSYACAKRLNTTLLYKGRDFSHTDLAST